MLFALFQESRIAARNAQKGEDYRSPTNGLPMILKHGSIKIPHFAYKIKPLDPDLGSEPESYSHDYLKMALQILLGISDEYVEYTRIPGVRPDLLYKKIALEVQHSAITIEEMDRRNLIYRENGYSVLWLFHTSRGYARDQFTGDKVIYLRKYSIISEEITSEYRLKAPERHKIWRVYLNILPSGEVQILKPIFVDVWREKWSDWGTSKYKCESIFELMELKNITPQFQALLDNNIKPPIIQPKIPQVSIPHFDFSTFKCNGNKPKIMKKTTEGNSP